MIEIWVILFVVWLVVTCVGHLSWVIVEAVFKAFVPPASKAPESRSGTPPKQDDYETTKRLINRCLSSGHLTPQRADEVFLALQKIRYRQGVADSESSQVDHPVRSGSMVHVASQASKVHPAPGVKPSALKRESIDESRAPSRSEPSSLGTEELAVSAQSLSQDLDIADAELVSRPIGKQNEKVSLATTNAFEAPSEPGFSDPKSSDRVSDLQSKGAPSSSLAKVIQSFLSAHNIRWGEIVAGILIVVCSIGLVRTLWQPIVSTHPLIPSLIFLVANIAIGSAGLYTLKRWKLRHTSRAVLIISVLLIPLSVLAGIAAVGRGDSLVASADPVTLLFIFAAFVFYSRLAYLCISAVTHRAYSWLVTFVFIVPISVMPFTRAAVELLGPSAGWLLGIAALSVQVVTSRLDRMKGKSSAGLGSSLSRLRLLSLGFGLYAFVIATAYFVLCLKEAGVDQYLALAVSTIPAFISFGTSSFELKKRASVATHSLVGYIGIFLLATPAFIIAVPAATSVGWIWAWAAVLTASILWVSYRSCQPHWSALVAIPTALSAIISIKVHGAISGIPPATLWSGALSGETLLILLSTTVLVGLWSLVERNRERKKWIVLSLLVWAGATVAISGALVVLPANFLGGVPLWGLQVVLGTSALLSAFACWSDGLPHKKLVYGSTLQTILFSLSLFKPASWIASAALEPFIWAMLLAGAFIWIVEVFWHRWGTRESVQDGVDLSDQRVRFLFVDGIVTVCCIACLAMVGLGEDLSRVVTLLFMTTLLMLMASIRSLSSQRLLGSQVISVLTMGLFTYQGVAIEGWVEAEHFSVDSWLAGNPQWILIVPCLFLLAIWLLIREVVSWCTMRVGGRFLKDVADNSAQGVERLDSSSGLWDLAYLKSSSGSFTFEFSLLSAAILLAFTAVLSGFSQSLYTLEVVTVGKDVLGYVGCDLAALAVLAFGLKRYGAPSKNRIECCSLSLMISAVFAAGWIVSTMLDSSQGRVYLLVLTTLLSALGLIVCSRMTLRERVASSWTGQKKLELSCAVVVLIVSLRLLWADWIGPVVQGEQPLLVTMIPVALWSLVGSLWFRYGRSTLIDTEKNVLSLASLVVTTIIVPTLIAPLTTFEFVQFAGFACLMWALTFLRSGHMIQNEKPSGVLKFALGFGLLIGGLTSVMTTLCVFVIVPYFTASFGGFLVSLTASIVLVTKLGGSYLAAGKPLRGFLVASWPISVSLLAGQIAWVFFLLFNLNAAETRVCVGLIWVATSLVTLYRERMGQRLISRAHIVGVGVVTPVIALGIYPTEKIFAFVALIALLITGMLVQKMSHSVQKITLKGFSGVSYSQMIVVRCIGWWVLLAGSLLLKSLLLGFLPAASAFDLFPIWSVAWLMIWVAKNWVLKETSESSGGMIIVHPFLGVIVVLCCLSTMDLVWAVSHGAINLTAGSSGIPSLHTLKWVAFSIVPCMVMVRPSKPHAWFLGFYQVSVSVAYVALIIASQWAPALMSRLVIAGLAIALLNALLSHWSASLARVICRVRGLSVDAQGACCIAHYAIIVLTTLGNMIGVVLMIADGVGTSTIHLMVASVAIGGWGIAQCAAAMNQQKMRKLAVATMLSAIALWAGADIQIDLTSILQVVMRWIVVSVILLPAMVWVLPSLLGNRIWRNWAEASRWGIAAVGLSTAFAIGAMLGLEVVTRTSVGVMEIPSIQILLVGCVLVLLTLVLAAIAVFSGPKFSLQQRLGLSDSNRGFVIYGAELLSGCVWLHLYLCRPDWLYIELRDSWCFFVMAIAFVSVGVTEFARRFGDDVLLKVFRRTAFLLPLIPILGFWLQYAVWFEPLLKAGSVIRYDVLLLIGAIYYGLVSQLWNHASSRLVSIALGNAAWWFMLTQTPGWSFLEHPQLWLIPPAFCILFAVNHYRDRLGKPMVSAIRYASMLAIYLSSTADMLIQEIGVSLMGPIVLILLSLAGMLAGVILRVRAFLFLGASFVLLGTTSMVWHANRSLGSSWPWWVFGITTGVLLLVGLSLLEKYKSKLREYSSRLSRWDA